MKNLSKLIIIIAFIILSFNSGCVSTDEQNYVSENITQVTLTIPPEKDLTIAPTTTTEITENVKFYNFEDLNLTAGDYCELKLNEVFTNIDEVFGKGYLKKGDSFMIELISEYPVNVLMLESAKVTETFKIRPLIWSTQYKKWDYWDGAQPIFREDNVTHIQSNISISENGFYSIVIDGRMVGNENYPDFWNSDKINIIIKKYSEIEDNQVYNPTSDSIQQTNTNEYVDSSSYYGETERTHPYYLAGMLAGDEKGNIYIITSVNDESGVYKARRLSNSYNGEYYLLSDNTLGEKGYHYNFNEFDKSFPIELGYALRIGLYDEVRPTGTMFAYLEIDNENEMKYVSSYYASDLTELDYSIGIQYSGDLSIYKTMDNKSNSEILSINGIKKIEIGKSSFVYLNIKRIDDSRDDLKIVLYANYLPLMTGTLVYPENEYTLYHDTTKIYPLVNDTIISH